MSRIHILYENSDWLSPIEAELKGRNIDYKLHFVNEGSFDLSKVPEEGVYLNRMSPSSHTRGHLRGVLLTRELLRWLEFHGRRVINGSQAFSLELSKIQQDIALRKFGILTPRTIAVVGKDKLKSAARDMSPPFITKHNQGGKGLGVKLFNALESFDSYVDDPEFVDDPNGINLIQEYIEPKENFITRVEIVGGHFILAIHSSTAGGFKLCPADECDGAEKFCPADGDGMFSPAWEIGPDDDLVEKYIKLMDQNKIDVAGIEFVQSSDGRRYTYDINTTTNYNSDVEAQLGINGMASVVDLASELLAIDYPEILVG
ncbi:MAG: alpha-L-glutamate ligase [Candidatus Neomarinimicrobiota bacterium]|nr:alpha-L-glutamate ligase [Candidatus Neomarinimicrobiota bacterium]